MGCHTWFGRPLSSEEISNLIPYAYKTLEKWKNNPDYSIEHELYTAWKKKLDEKDAEMICSLGKGDNYIYFVNGKPYLDLAGFVDTGETRFQIPKHFHDNFRVSNYPEWVAYNKRQLRRKMKKKYFDLTQEQLDEISLFWKMYPGGIIQFG